VIVYELRAQSNDYATLQFDDERDLDLVFDAFAGEHWPDRWRPLPVHWATESGRFPVPDFAVLSGAPVFSSGALEALDPLLEGNGELLPLDVTDQAAPWSIFNVTRMTDALDQGLSEVARFPNGGVMRVKRFVFRPAPLAGATIFKLPEQPVRVYVTDVFADQARAAGLTGMDLIERWRDF
jgi:hypothetical protein